MAPHLSIMILVLTSWVAQPAVHGAPLSLRQRIEFNSLLLKRLFELNRLAVDGMNDDTEYLEFLARHGDRAHDDDWSNYNYVTRHAERGGGVDDTNKMSAADRYMLVHAARKQDGGHVYQDADEKLDVNRSNDDNYADDPQNAQADGSNTYARQASDDFNAQSINQATDDDDDAVNDENGGGGVYREQLFGMRKQPYLGTFTPTSRVAQRAQADSFNNNNKNIQRPEHNIPEPFYSDDVVTSSSRHNVPRWGDVTGLGRRKRGPWGETQPRVDSLANLLRAQLSSTKRNLRKRIGLDLNRSLENGAIP